MINGMLHPKGTRPAPAHRGVICLTGMVRWARCRARFPRWRKAGVWDRIWALLQHHADVAGHRDWDMHYVDGFIGRAHQHAAGAGTLWVKGTLLPTREVGAKVAFQPNATFRLKGEANHARC